MGMELRHEFTVPATLEETWEAFNDIESVAACFPGAAVTSVEGESFTGTCKVKLGPIALVYNGTGTFVEKDEAARRMVIDAKGKDKRGNGTAGAHVVAQMTAAGTSTRVEVATDLNITGKPAQFGRGVMQDVSDKLLGQFTACLEQKVGDTSAASRAAAEGEAADDPAAPSSPPSAASSTTTPTTPTPSQAPEGAGPATDMSSATAVPASAPPKAAPPYAPPRTVNPPGNDDALDLGATVLPVLAKAYWKQAAAAVMGLLVLLHVLRRKK